MPHKKKKEHEKKLKRCSCGTTETDGEAWKSNDPLKMETSKEGGEHETKHCKLF
jgi:hypothetical protein